MLYTVLAYLMLFAALSNAVCSYDTFLPLIFANAFCLMLLLLLARLINRQDVSLFSYFALVY